MSTASEVVELLPPEMPTGWALADIEEMLKTKTANRILANAWSVRASKTSSFVDISESGSSRSMTSIYRNAIEMAKMYGDRADKEEQDSKGGGTSRSRTHKAVRV